MSPLAARLDGLASDVHRLARRLLGTEGLRALSDGSVTGATLDPAVVGLARGADVVTEGLRQMGRAAGLDPAEVASIGADHYGRRPAAPPASAPTAQEVSDAR